MQKRGETQKGFVVALVFVLVAVVGVSYLSSSGSTGKAVSTPSLTLDGSAQTHGQQTGKYCTSNVGSEDGETSCSPDVFKNKGTWCSPDNQGLQVQGCEQKTDQKCTFSADGVTFKGYWCYCSYTCAAPGKPD